MQPGLARPGAAMINKTPRRVSVLLDPDPALQGRDTFLLNSERKNLSNVFVFTSREREQKCR
jgi:hypothetical protein